MKEEQEIKVNQPVAEDLSDLYHYQGSMSPERYQAIRKDLNMAEPIQPDPRMKEHYKRLNPTGRSEVFGNAGFHNDRTSTQANIFKFYLMAKHDMDFDQASGVLPGHENYDKLMTEFMKFVGDHPVRGEGLKDEKRKENSVEWAKVFMDCAEKMKSYKIPDIDYSDPKQVSSKNKQFRDLKSAAIDFGQEFNDMLMKNGDAVEIKTKLGEDYIKAQTTVWVRSQKFVGGFERAYDYGDLKPTVTAGGLPMYASLIATHRADFAKTGNEFRGKTFGECFKLDMTPTELAYDTLYGVWESEIQTDRETYSFQSALDYCRGTNKDFENKLRGSQKLWNESRYDFNAAQYDKVIQFGKQVDIAKKESGDLMQEIFGTGKTGEEIAALMDTEKGTKILAEVDQCFHKMELDNQNAFYKSINTTTTELVKVGGKTAQELWGEKYAKVTDPAKKEMLLRAEVVNAAIYGDQPVTVDVHVYSPKLSVRKNEPVAVRDTPENLARQKAFYEELEALHKELKEAKQRLIDTQDDPEANFTRGAEAEGSEYYRNMTAALQKCIDLTDKTKRSNNMEDLRQGLEEYKKASAAYVKERDDMFHAWRGYGRDRLKEAKDAVKSVPDKLKQLDELSKGLIVSIPPNCRKTGMFRINECRDTLELLCKRSGLVNGSADITPEQTLAAKEKVQNTIQLRAKLQNKITRMSQDAVTTFEKLDYSIAGDTITQKARDYYKAIYSDQIKKAGPKQLQELSQTMNTKAFNQKFHQDADKLAGDPLFQRCVKEQPKNFIAAYYANVKHAEQKAQQKEQQKEQKKVQQDPKKTEELQKQIIEKYNQKVEKAGEVVELQKSDHYKARAVVKAAALLYADTLVKKGQLEPGRPAYDHAEKSLNDPVFARAMYQEDGKNLLSGKEIKALVTGPDAQKNLKAAMDHAKVQIAKEKEIEARDLKASINNDHNKTTEELSSEIQNDHEKKFGSHRKQQGKGMGTGGR
ncbi:MAG: hypothetical protein K6E18_04530 [Lachnospiraceae bacterium]|nr:hypothetical protein [Lachnospiraceae bacterium]